MDGQYRFIGKELLLFACDLQMMLDLACHVFVLEPIEMTSADNTGGQGPGSMIHELVQQVVLT